MQRHNVVMAELQRRSTEEQRTHSASHDPLYRENGVVRLLQGMLPDGWVCPEENSTGIRSDGLSLLSPGSTNGDERISLIKGNKCIKISALIPAVNRRRSENNLPSIHAQIYPREESIVDENGDLEHVYYFEVFFISGMCSVGFVAGSEDQSPNDLSENTSSSGPGMLPESIGLDFDGNLWLSGVRLNGGLGGHSDSVGEIYQSSWTTPFANGDTIGCGIFVGQFPKYFFTRNGVVINPGTDICCCAASIETPLFPAVGVSSLMETVIRTNFGFHRETPFLWNGSNRVRIISHAVSESSTSLDGSFIDAVFAPTPFARGHTVSGARNNPPPIIYAESHERNTVVEQVSSQAARIVRNNPTARLDESLRSSTRDLDYLDNMQLDISISDRLKRNFGSDDMESRSQAILDVNDLKELARELRSVACASDAHPGVLSSLTDLCRSKLKLLNDLVEEAMGSDSCDVDLAEILNIHEMVTDAIEAAEKKQSEIGFHDSFSTASVVYPFSSTMSQTVVPNVKAEKEDVCSLLCHLRRQKQTRLDAAWKLLSLAKEGTESNACHEIISSGGMHSLLSIFKTSRQIPKLMMVSALTVAHLVPSLADSDAISSSNVNMGAIECLRYLIELSRSYSDDDISPAEILSASAFAMTNLWINALEPMLRKSGSMLSKGIERFETRENDAFSSKRLAPRRRGSAASQNEQDVECSVLIEEFTALSIIAAELGAGGDTNGNNLWPVRDMNVYYSFALTIESICAVEYAQPIAMREGVIKVLIQWLRSKDTELMLHSANALRNLTSSRDNYMAGWIHSQILNENALVHIVGRLESTDVRVRLAIAEVISSLTVAPHTRAAIIEARGVKYLVQLLGSVGEGTHDEALALASGNALLRLASGAAASSGGTRNECVIDDIIQNGALESLVSMAKAEHYGSLRLLSIKILRIMSEAPHSLPHTRHKLCDSGAVTALGTTLRDDVMFIRSSMDNSSPESNSSDLINGTFSNDFLTCSNALSVGDVLEEMRHVMRGLANILQHSFLPDEEENLRVFAVAYTHLISSGGVKSLLWIATIDQSSCSTLEITNWDCLRDIQIDACGTLASLCPILVFLKERSRSAMKWAPYVLSALLSILKNEVLVGSVNADSLGFPDVCIDALQGLGSLAEYEPLKTRIIDEFLPQLLKLQQCEENRSFSYAATQVCLSLGFNEVETGVGLDAYLLSDKFSFNRSRLIQAMARDEIRRFMDNIWTPSLRAILRSHDAEQQKNTGDDPEFGSKLLSHLFRSLAYDEDSADLRDSVRNQFTNLYDCLPTTKRTSSFGQRSFTRTMLRSHSYVDSQDFDDFKEHLDCVREFSNESVLDVNMHSLSELLDVDYNASEMNRSDMNNFLQCHQYPINGSLEERDWIMKHCRALDETHSALSAPSLFLPSRVYDLLRVYFPSALIRDEVIPLYEFQVNATFDFRALAMPSGRYFSFRREGQLISHECEDLYLLHSEQTHCTLGFSNSSFAGEFTESLLQALYLCPIIRGLSFSNDPIIDIDDHESGCDAHEGSELLASLVRVLPSSISYLTFDNVLNNEAALSLGETLKAMSASSELPRDVIDKNRGVENLRMGKGFLRALAITNSPHIEESTFISLIDSMNFTHQNCFVSPLQFLKVLDFSGNGLGDNGSANILSVALSPSSLASIERIDLSKNVIREGRAVKSVLQECQSTISKLQVLNIAWNELGIGDTASHIVQLLPTTLAGLTSLDISGNSLSDEFFDILGDCISKKCHLIHLNLSHNRFSRPCLNSILSRLHGMGKSGVTHQLSFIRIAGNIPPLSPSQEMMLNEITSLNRHRHVTSYLERSLPLDSSERSIGTHMSSSSSDSVQHLKSNSLHGVQVHDISTNSAVKESSVAGRNMITVLFSAPLVWRDDQNTYYPIEMLDFKLEKSLLWQCFSEASRNIDLSYDNATTDRLQAVITKGCGCLHFSGHGHPNFLTFEDGSGGIHWLGVEQLKALISGGVVEGNPPFNFVFVSACHSALAGQTFVDSGVPHVVCCQQEAQLMDSAALSFTRAFYLALAFGRTVKDSFEIGKQAVSCSPTVPNPVGEMEKFMLLPEDGNHDVPIFNAESVSEWPSSRVSSRARNSVALPNGLPSESGQHTLPTPPQGFLGREADMYHVLNLVLSRRFVNIVGPTGIGRSSLAAALCHYIEDRKSTMMFDHLFFVRSVLKRSGAGKSSPIISLHNNLVSMGKAKPLPTDADLDDIIEEISFSLRQTKSLIVFDRTEALEGTVEEQDLHFFLGQIFSDTKDVHVLITSKKSVGLSSNVGVGENTYNLGPLNLRSTIKLFAFLCPRMHSSRERKELLDLLAPNIETNGHAEDDGLSMKIKSILGEGIPAKIFSVAYQMTAHDFQELKNLG